MFQIHPNARTTPAVRAAIAASAEPSGVLAKRYGVSTEVSVVWQLRRDWFVGAVHPCSGRVMFQGRRSATRLIG